MTWLLFLLIGIAIGWLIEFLIDLFYWRSRRICPDPPVTTIVPPAGGNLIENTTRLIRLEGERDHLLSIQTTMQTQIATLKEQLHAREVSLAECRARESHTSTLLLGQMMTSRFSISHSSTDLPPNSTPQSPRPSPSPSPPPQPTPSAPPPQADPVPWERVPCADRPNAPCRGQRLDRPPETSAVRARPAQRHELNAAGRQFLLLWGMDAETIRNLERAEITNLETLLNSEFTPELSNLLSPLQAYYPDTDVKTIHESLASQASFIQSRNWERLQTEQAAFRTQFSEYGDDLTLIWGINNATSRLLQNVYGVRTFRDLRDLGQAGSTIAREILVETGWLKLSATELWSAWLNQADLAGRNLLTSLRRAQTSLLAEWQYDQRHNFLIIPTLTPAREERLRQQQVHSFADLAALSLDQVRRAIPWNEISAYFPSGKSADDVYNTIISLAALLRDGDFAAFQNQQAAFRRDCEREALALYVGLDENEAALNALGINRHEEMAATLNGSAGNGLDLEIELVAHRLQVAPQLVRQAWKQQNSRFQDGDALGMAALMEKMATGGLEAAH